MAMRRRRKKPVLSPFRNVAERNGFVLDVAIRYPKTPVCEIARRTGLTRKTVNSILKSRGIARPLWYPGGRPVSHKAGLLPSVVIGGRRRTREDAMAFIREKYRLGLNYGKISQLPKFKASESVIKMVVKRSGGLSEEDRKLHYLNAFRRKHGLDLPAKKLEQILVDNASEPLRVIAGKLVAAEKNAKKFRAAVRTLINALARVKSGGK